MDTTWHLNRVIASLATRQHCHHQYATSDAVYAGSQSATSFFSCSFVGDYGDDECVIDSDGTLEFYYTQAFSNGTVCSDATTAIVVYNGDAVVPFSSSSSADLLSCQDESISEFCAFDCAAGLGGVGIECR